MYFFIYITAVLLLYDMYVLQVYDTHHIIQQQGYIYIRAYIYYIMYLSVCLVCVVCLLCMCMMVSPSGQTSGSQPAQLTGCRIRSDTAYHVVHEIILLLRLGLSSSDVCNIHNNSSK